MFHWIKQVHYKNLAKDVDRGVRRGNTLILIPLQEKPSWTVDAFIRIVCELMFARRNRFAVPASSLVKNGRVCVFLVISGASDYPEAMPILLGKDFSI